MNYRYKKVIKTYGSGRQEEEFIIQEKILPFIWLTIKESNGYSSWNMHTFSEELAIKKCKELEDKLVINEKYD